MYISPRVALIRNLSVSIVSGGITLVILLIAPLGLMAVIINTLLVTFATYATNIFVDRVIVFLQRDRQSDLFPQLRESSIHPHNSSRLDRRQ